MLLKWDNVGTRTFQAGVDRGVLYLSDGSVVPWNGLTSVEDNTVREGRSFYQDGVKYLETVTPGEFSGRIKAFTYPAEFDAVNGVEPVAQGLFYHDQPSSSFSLSYRTRVGNNQEGADHGYKIHLLYNVIALPESVAFNSLGSEVSPAEFGWALNGVPPKMLRGYRPTVHISLDSTRTDPDTLAAIEDVLYGTAMSAPRLPGIDELTQLFKAIGVLVIVDNGDGTWTAIDRGNEYISMLDSTTFQIAGANAVFLDTTTYEISTTNPE